MIPLNLTPDNIEMFETMDFADTTAYLEKLDEEYYRQILCFSELIEVYGNSIGNRMYSSRDLYLNFQQKYIQDHQIKIYDVNDGRQCFSRRI